MYSPSHFEETRIDVLHALMRERPLATLVTLSPAGIEANHIPLLLRDDGSEFGMLAGHVARANPLWREHDPAAQALAIFHGPQAYITPNCYRTKQETGKVVPTWNYAVVHAGGPLRVVDEPAWLRAQIAALTAHNEAGLPAPWAVADAPEEFIDKMIHAIVGIEIPILRLTGKWKVSQNQPARNREGVALGLRGCAPGDAFAMADLVEAWGGGGE